MKPRIALSMIVRNAEADLPRCLASVGGIVDETVVADTGSSDSTCQVAAQHGARVLRIPWADDFAQARNQALAAIDADWVLVLDADEQLGPEARVRIPALVLREEVKGYLVTIRNYVPSLQQRVWDRPAKPNDGGALETAKSYPAYVEHENVRLFRRDPEIYFVGRVHETVGRRITQIGGLLPPADFCIHHFGMVASPETQARKNRFYRELGQRKVEELPLDAQAHFELGVVEFDNFHHYEAALGYFLRACELKPSFGISWLFAALAALRLERYAAALQLIREAQAQRYISPLVLETEGDAHYHLEEFAEARTFYSRALQAGPGSAFLESKLALAELRCGETEVGLRRLRRAVQTEQDTPELHDRLITALVFAGRLAEAAEAAEAKLALAEPDERTFLRAASIWAKLGDWPRARQNIAAGLARFPRSERLQSALAEIVNFSPLSKYSRQNIVFCH
jgi:glycosyltransferase involved in cell wall biosynthesis